MLIACATAASVFPYLGTIVYTILRPPEFLEDREERELELRAAELELRQRIEQSCPHCEYPVERSYLRCPNCERRLRNPCRKCHKPLDPSWGICPYCETEVRKQQRPEREARRTDRQRAARAAAQRKARTDGTTRRERRGARGGARRAAESLQPVQPLIRDFFPHVRETGRHRQLLRAAHAEGCGSSRRRPGGHGSPAAR